VATLPLQSINAKTEHTCKCCNQKCGDFYSVGSRDSFKVDNWKFCNFICLYKFLTAVTASSWKDFVTTYGSNGSRLEDADEEDFLQIFSQQAK
jgi:hypothetical protein